MAAVALFIVYVFTHFLLLYSAESCPVFFCNEIVGKISFPFKNETQAPECGYYSINCSDPRNTKIQLKEGGYWFQFESINQRNTVFINDSKLRERIDSLKGDECDDGILNDLSLPMDSTIVYVSTRNHTLFRCSNTLDKTPAEDPNYACRSANYTYYTSSNDSLNCSAIQIPILSGSPSNIYNPSALTAKFYVQVQYTNECTQCYTTGGKCLDNYGKFKCGRGICWDEQGQFNCFLAEEGKCQNEEEEHKCRTADSAPNHIRWRSVKIGTTHVSFNMNLVVSHKSDVYSYGMMLSEMVGGRRNINVDVEETSEIYFPHWIYKRLELDEDLGLQCITNDEDKKRARKMIIVSLWCIQTDPSNRLAMKDVIEMLEGSVESLQIPPKTYLSSPPKSPAPSSTTLVSIQ